MAGRDLSAELFGAATTAAPAGRDMSADLFPSPAPASVAPLSRMDRLIKGVRDPIDGGAQLLTKMLPQGIVDAGNSANNWLADKTGLVARLPEGGVDQMTRDAEAAYQSQRAAGGESGFDGYRTIGNVVSPANLALAARVPAAATLAGRIGVGALAGGASGALTPVGSGDFWTEKAKQTALGAGVGGAVPVAMGAAARVINPNAASNPNLALLQSEGVQPTIGQTLGGWAGRAEEKLQSVPILGDAISAARTRALGGFNRAAINRASGEVGTDVQSTGQAGVQEAGDAISAAYDSALNKISGVQLGGQFNQSLLQLRGMAQGLTAPMRTKFNDTVNQTLLRKVGPNGSILPGDYKAIDSELGNMAGRYGKSQVASEQEFGDAVTQLKALLKDQMMRSNPQVAGELSAADAAWANLVRVEGAAKSAKNTEGIFTPGQLNMAIQGADGSVRNRAVSRGTALMQDLGNAGQSVLGNKVPNSGTAERLLYGGGALTAGFYNPLIPASLLGGAAMYTPTAQRLLGAAVTSRPGLAQPAANALRSASPMLVPGAAQLGLGLLNQ